MNADQLKDLREKEKEFFARWTASGKKIAGYLCGHCGVKKYALRPTADATNDRGCWDSLTTCTSCGNMNFVTVFPDGRTIAKPVE